MMSRIRAARTHHHTPQAPAAAAMHAQPAMGLHRWNFQQESESVVSGTLYEGTQYVHDSMRAYHVQMIVESCVCVGMLVSCGMWAVCKLGPDTPYSLATWACRVGFRVTGHAAHVGMAYEYVYIMTREGLQ